ncbi:WD repeat-containing protein 76 isoform X1 [Hypomesus transpacificus]|uniref:WD repeat-containing protein 76 isoform X1 n=1 Tax=Hypomesus transpacificus TaxID=137520 RepID=UPI001F07C0A8|nr:WD repeat-containing protein 76 isoform X1 [Hypomesus transpacificus]
MIHIKEMTPPADNDNDVGGLRRSTRNKARMKPTIFAPTTEGFAPRRIKYSSKDYIKATKRKVTHVDSYIENSDAGLPKGLSSYELERLENIRQNQAFLSTIKLFEAREELNQTASPKPSQRGRKSNSKSSVREVLPPRKSLRLQNKDAESLLLPPKRHAMTSSYKKSSPTQKPEGPILMVPLTQEDWSPLPPELIKLWTEVSVTEEKQALDLKEYSNALKRLRTDKTRVVKVVKDRIFSAAFHPCTSRLLLAAGDKSGHLGLWSPDCDWGGDGVLLFEPHLHPVSCMAFSASSDLLSLSYDGTLRSTDVEKAVFDDVYRVRKGLHTFDFLSRDCSTLVVGEWNGDVAIVDRRTPGTSYESLHTLDSKTIRCVSVHPLHKQYFVVAENWVVSIYDARFLKTDLIQAVSQLHGHPLSISSAYFSPNTGNRVLTCSFDNKIRVYDTSSITSNAPLLTSIKHDMQSACWLSKASWDPKQEDCFLVGSMEKPFKVQVFHETGQLQHSLRDKENLTTMQSVTMFHPSRNAVLGGNSSGRLHLFTD